MSERYGYDNSEGIWYDTTKPTGETCPDRGALYQEVDVDLMVEDLHREQTRLRAQLAEAQSREASAISLMTQAENKAYIDEQRERALREAAQDLSSAWSAGDQSDIHEQAGKLFALAATPEPQEDQG